MKSSATPVSRLATADYRRISQALARQAYRLFASNPRHQSLRFKTVHRHAPIYSVRVALGYRAVGLLEGNGITWFWIGSHADYDRPLGKL